MVKIDILGEIGWNVFSVDVQDVLNNATGDVEIDLSSIGGSLFEAIEIYNAIRDYKRNNPQSQMILNIKGVAASAASYIASNPAFDLVTIEDNATYMIHNPIMGAIGDYQEFETAVEHLKRLAAMVAGPYAQKSGKNIKEIRQMMDKTTWFYGKEIIKAGFADEVITTKKSKSKESAIAENEIMLKQLKKKIQEAEMKDDYFEKIAAIASVSENIIDNTNIMSHCDNGDSTANGGENNNNAEAIMDSKELLSKHPEIHAEIMKAGEDKGKADEKERVKSLLEMKKKKDFDGIEMIHDRIDEGIANGETVQAVELGIMAILKKNDVKAAIDTNDIGDIKQPSTKTVSGEEPKIVDNGRREF